ncbi:hypothetical protein L484_001443 [Morus notabilis]|uniref:Uncharacterized protein n=1 Tax=Morus notabilis TaxID=981085 RepID=W9QB60_9ROSA|nr:hypothetical protein L484_001443 [Morus notabilis]
MLELDPVKSVMLGRVDYLKLWFEGELGEHRYEGEIVEKNVCRDVFGFAVLHKKEPDSNVPLLPGQNVGHHVGSTVVLVKPDLEISFLFYWPARQFNLRRLQKIRQTSGRKHRIKILSQPNPRRKEQARDKHYPTILAEDEFA